MQLVMCRKENFLKINDCSLLRIRVGLGLRVRVRSRVRVHPGVAAAAVQGHVTWRHQRTFNNFGAETDRTELERFGPTRKGSDYRHSVKITLLVGYYSHVQCRYSTIRSVYLQNLMTKTLITGAMHMITTMPIAITCPPISELPFSVRNTHSATSEFPSHAAFD